MGEITDVKTQRVPEVDENVWHNAELIDRVYNADRESSDKIRDDIERTRAEMDETLSMLRGRLDLSELASDAFAYGKEKWAEKSPDIVDTIKRNPGPIALLASSIGWMIYRANSHDGETEFRAKERLSDTGEAISEKARDVGQAISEKARGAMQSARESVGSAKQRAADKLRDTRDAAREKLSQTGEQISTGTRQTAMRVRESFSESLQDNPLAVGALALAVGAACGLAIPLTQKEEEVIGSVGQPKQELGMMSQSSGEFDETSSEYRGPGEGDYETGEYI